jgi:hypothetical protein
MCLLAFIIHADKSLGEQLQPQGLLLEGCQQLPKVYHRGSILMTQNLVASYEYPSVIRKVLT